MTTRCPCLDEMLDRMPTRLAAATGEEDPHGSMVGTRMPSGRVIIQTTLGPPSLSHQPERRRRFSLLLLHSSGVGHLEGFGGVGEVVIHEDDLVSRRDREGQRQCSPCSQLPQSTRTRPSGTSSSRSSDSLQRNTRLSRRCGRRRVRRRDERRGSGRRRLRMIDAESMTLYDRRSASGDQVSTAPTAAPAGRSMPIRTSWRWACAMSSGSSASRVHWHGPRCQPSEIGREPARQLDPDGPGEVRRRKRSSWA